MDYEMFDGLELGAEDCRVQRGDGGLVTGWLLLKAGRNELWKQGRPFVLELSAEMLESAVALQRAKGEKLPIDSRHALYHAARRAGVEESEALRQVPGGVAALGFGSLETRGGDLWLTDVEWGPLAREMMEEKMLRYYSPVIRGLDGRTPFRVTSVAMDNVPALSNLPAIAAGAEAHNQEETNMKKTEDALKRLLDDGGLALGDEADEAIAARIGEVADLLADMKAKLAEAEAAIAALKEGKEAAETKVAELEMGAEAGRKKALVEQALAEGRVTNAQARALEGLSSVALGEFLKATPAQAVPGKGPAPKKDEDELCLTAEERDMAERMGVPEADMLAAKRWMNC